MPTTPVTLEYLRVFLTAPVIWGILVVAFVVMFRDELSGLISAIGELRLPGGASLLTSQRARTSGGPSGRPTSPSVSEEDVKVPQSLSLRPEDVAHVQQLLLSERRNAVLWEYRFLNLFLVPRTQQTLDWIATLPEGLSDSQAESILMQYVPDARERDAVVSALQTHRLIELDNGLIRVTPKGRDYIAWRGDLPKMNQYGSA